MPLIGYLRSTYSNLFERSYRLTFGRKLVIFDSYMRLRSQLLVVKTFTESILSIGEIARNYSLTIYKLISLRRTFIHQCR
jgi:hypothetical protein